MESTISDEQTQPAQPRHAGPFAQIPTQAIEDKRLSAESVRLLAALCSHADKYGECHPLQRWLAYDLGIKQPAVSKLLAPLITYGYVAIIGRRFVSGSWHTVYQIQYQPPVPADVTADIPPRNIPPADIPPRNIPPRNNNNISKSSLAGTFTRERDNIGATPSLSLLEGPIYEALCAALKTRPIGSKARHTWASGIAEMQASGITPRDIPRAVQLYRQKYTDAIPCHPKALIDNWSAIGAPVNGEKPYASETGAAYQHGSGAPGSQLTDAQRDAWLTSLFTDSTRQDDSA